jgi:hypothetical protein
MCLKHVIVEVKKIKQISSAKKNYSHYHGGISHTFIKIAPDISSPLVPNPIIGQAHLFIFFPNSLCPYLP